MFLWTHLSILLIMALAMFLSLFINISRSYYCWSSYVDFSFTLLFRIRGIGPSNKVLSGSNFGSIRNCYLPSISKYRFISFFLSSSLNSQSYLSKPTSLMAWGTFAIASYMCFYNLGSSLASCYSILFISSGEKSSGFLVCFAKNLPVKFSISFPAFFMYYLKV